VSPPASAKLDRVRQAVADVFGVDAGGVTAESSPQSIEAWDSMGHLNLVLALEQSFGVQFSPEEIAGMTSVSLIIRTLDAKGGA
jgi:acyl carrier protein